MDVPRCVLVQWHRLQQNVTTTFFGFGNVDELEKVIIFLENIGVTLLADFAFKLLPVVRSYVFAVLFDVPLLLQPVLQALKMNQSHRASALAR